MLSILKFWDASDLMKLFSIFKRSMGLALRARKFSDYGHFSSWFDLRTQSPQIAFVVGSNRKVIPNTFLTSSRSVRGR